MESVNTKTRHCRHVLGVRDVMGGREGVEHQKHAKTAHYGCSRDGEGADQRETCPDGHVSHVFREKSKQKRKACLTVAQRTVPVFAHSSKI